MSELAAAVERCEFPRCPYPVCACCAHAEFIDVVVVKCELDGRVHPATNPACTSFKPVLAGCRWGGERK